jgi:hypothetical protein
MDIKPPAQASAAEPVKTPPPEAGDIPATTESKPTDQKPSKPAKQPRPYGSGTALAIVATVIIVLGLGTLFVLAYLQSQG